jgi:hypothetical protein
MHFSTPSVDVPQRPPYAVPFLQLPLQTQEPSDKSLGDTFVSWESAGVAAPKKPTTPIAKTAQPIIRTILFLPMASDAPNRLDVDLSELWGR